MEKNKRDKKRKEARERDILQNNLAGGFGAPFVDSDVKSATYSRT